METTAGLSSGPDTPTTTNPACPECGAAADPLPALPVPLAGGDLWRCPACGARTVEDGDRRVLEFCERCALPRPGGPTAGDGLCESCGADDAADVPVDTVVVEATENEVRAALVAEWRWVSAAKTQGYVDRVVRAMAGQIDDAPADSHAVLFDHGGVRTLALPSGTVLISTGALRAVDDEAELAFVVGRELAHVASGAAAERLVRIGLRLATDRDSKGGEPWMDTALAVMRLGHGAAAEAGADETAIVAMHALGYDVAAAARFVERSAEGCRKGDEQWAELALAQPPDSVRLPRIRRVLATATDGAAQGRINREVFRRAAGHSVLAEELGPVDARSAGFRRDGAGSLAGRLWIAAALVAALAVVWILIDALG